MAPRLRRLLNWLFRDHRSGRIVIAQFPNIPLLGWIAASLVGRLLDGTAATVFAAIATIALVAWALDELVRGVNPWRRMLGGAVLGVQFVGLSLAVLP